jgi:PucR family transcriptional regulator, purine catabolism regulatory protein
VRSSSSSKASLGPAAVVCALEIAKQRAVAETEYRLQADVLEAALAGRFASETEVVARARALGYELDGDQVALVFGLDAATGPGALAAGPPPELGGEQGGALAGQLRPRLLDAIRRALEPSQRPALVRQQDAQVAVFVPLAGTDSPAIAREAETLRQAAATMLDGTTLTVGIGRPHGGVPGLSVGYREAAEALLIGQVLLGGNRTTSFGDLGIRRLLFPLRDSPELREFYDEFLGSLESYDERHGTELIRTLEGFFAHHGNHVRAAEALHLHRNTLLYRLARIQSIGGLDLDDPEVRLAVQVALRLRPLTVAGAPVPPGAGSREAVGVLPVRDGERAAARAEAAIPAVVGKRGRGSDLDGEEADHESDGAGNGSPRLASTRAPRAP